GAECVDADVFRIYLHVDLLGFGKDGHRDRRGVDAPAGLGLRHALHAVHARLVFQTRIDLVALDDRLALLNPPEPRPGTVCALNIRFPETSPHVSRRIARTFEISPPRTDTPLRRPSRREPRRSRSFHRSGL